MTPKSIGVKDKSVFVQTNALFQNQLYYYWNIVRDSDHHHR